MRTSAGDPRPGLPRVPWQLKTGEAAGWRGLVLAVTLAGSLSAVPAGAQGPPGWSGQVRLAFVATGGNAETETLSLRSNIGLEAEGVRFGFEAGGLQTNTTSFVRTAERTEAGDLVLIEEPSTSLSAERYWAKLHVRKRFGPANLFWFGRVEWDRNEPAGIQNRYTGIAGLGNDWVDRETLRFWTEYGYTINRERLRVEGLPGAANFPGLRLEWELWWKISDSSQLRNHLVANQNLENHDDLRAEMEQTLTVAISEHLSLQVGLELFYDDDPPLNRVPLVEDGRRTGEFVQVPFDDLDRYLTTSLVFSF